MQITKENYYSLEANRNYLSVSQIKTFAECEARAMAELAGEYKRPAGKAMIVGSYVHAMMESDEAVDEFMMEHSEEVYSARTGKKYADFEKADQMVQTLKDDNFAMFALSGEKEQIFIANVFGQDFKCKIDSINHEQRFFSDIKTAADFNKRIWSDKYNTMVSFVEAYDYVMQMFVYREILKELYDEYYDPYIVAVSKEDVPNKAVIHIDEERYVFEYSYVEELVARVAEVKAGNVNPVSCGNCHYCRQTKKLSNTIEVGDLLS